MASMNDFRTIEPDAFSHAVRYPAGVTLCRQGEPIHEVFQVENGLVKLMRVNATGRERIVGLRSEGWIVGAAAAILAEPASATAVTVTASEVSRMPAECFRLRLQSDRELSWRTHRMLSQEVDVDLIQAGDMRAIRARDRLVVFLRGLPAMPSEVPARAHRVLMPLRQWELAQLLGLTAPYLCRLLRDLERDGAVRRRGYVYMLLGDGVQK